MRKEQEDQPGADPGGRPVDLRVAVQVLSCKGYRWRPAGDYTSEVFEKLKSKSYEMVIAGSVAGDRKTMIRRIRRMAPQACLGAHRGAGCRGGAENPPGMGGPGDCKRPIGHDLHPLSNLGNPWKAEMERTPLRKDAAREIRRDGRAQGHLIGPDSPLRKAFRVRVHPFSVILWGPPGSRENHACQSPCTGGGVSFSFLFRRHVRGQRYERSGGRGGEDIRVGGQVHDPVRG